MKYKKHLNKQNRLLVLLSIVITGTFTSVMQGQIFKGNPFGMNEDILSINHDQSFNDQSNINAGVRLNGYYGAWTMFNQNSAVISWFYTIQRNGNNKDFLTNASTANTMSLNTVGQLSLYNTQNNDNPALMLVRKDGGILGVSHKLENNENQIGFADGGHNFLAYSSFHSNPNNRKFVVPSGSLIVGTSRSQPGNLDVKGNINAEKYQLNGSDVTFSQWANQGTNISFQGNVGIGKISSSVKLDVNGTINASNYTINGQPLNLGSSSDWTKTNTKLNYSQGNVGIGSTNPSSLLEIGVGNTTATTKLLTVNGGATFNNNSKNPTNKSLTTQVSINTNKKIQNAALTVAGTTFIGSWGELETLDGIKGNDLNTDEVNAVLKADHYDNFNLWVTKGIVSEDFAITAQANWADHVFKEDYKLPSLTEIAEFITRNKHLPGVISEKEVETKGYKFHDVNVVFLEKIENLYLYSIEQDKALKQQEQKLQSQNRILKQQEEKMMEMQKDLEVLKTTLLSKKNN